MIRVFTFFTAMFISVQCYAEGNAVDLWLDLRSEYINSLESDDFKRALLIANELLQIDPASTEAMLFVVLASEKANEPAPEWLMNSPWPNGTEQDRLNYEIASALLGN